MTKFLVVHDTTGRILAILGGNPLPIEPVGVPFKWVEIPQGKILTAIDAETGEPIFTDIPPSETEVLREDVMRLNTELLEIYEVLLLGGM